jgi:hypothetical protein
MSIFLSAKYTNILNSHLTIYFFSAIFAVTYPSVKIAYPNPDAVKMSEEDQVSLPDEPFQSDIIASPGVFHSYHHCGETDP